MWCGPALGGSLGTPMATYRISRQGNKVLRNRRRLQETEPSYIEPIPGGTHGRDTPISRETQVLGSEAVGGAPPQGQEDREVGWPIDLISIQGPGTALLIKWVWPGEERIPQRQGALKKGPSAN